MEYFMARRPRRNHSNDFKAKVALAAIKAEKTLAELSAEFDLHQNQIIDSKNQLIPASSQAFDQSKAPTDKTYLSSANVLLARLKSGQRFDQLTVYFRRMLDDTESCDAIWLGQAVQRCHQLQS